MDVRFKVHFRLILSNVHCFLQKTNLTEENISDTFFNVPIFFVLFFMPGKIDSDEEKHTISILRLKALQRIKHLLFNLITVLWHQLI